MKIERPELFLIDDDLYWACDSGWEEIDATFADMEELGIAKLPYENLDVCLPCHADLENHCLRPGGSLELYFRFRAGKYVSSEVRVPSWVDGGTIKPSQKIRPPDALLPKRVRSRDVILPNDGFGENETARWAEDTRKTLIVLLGTRGIVKERTKDKMAWLGIGHDKRLGIERPLYSTRLSLPLDLPATKTGTGISSGTIRPHLRRGHIRRQRYGPQFKFITRIWIESCFINADKEYVSNRRSYNVGLHSEAKAIGI